MNRIKEIRELAATWTTAELLPIIVIAGIANVIMEMKRKMEIKKNNQIYRMGMIFGYVLGMLTTLTFLYLAKKMYVQAFFSVCSFWAWIVLIRFYSNTNK